MDLDLLNSLQVMEQELFDEQAIGGLPIIPEAGSKLVNGALGIPRLCSFEALGARSALDEGDL